MPTRGAGFVACGLMALLATIWRPVYANGLYGNRFVGTRLINEYHILGNPRTTRRNIRLIQLLEARHLIDGVGCQAHFLEHSKTSIFELICKGLAGSTSPSTSANLI
jgi:hypothetical protein